SMSPNVPRHGWTSEYTRKLTPLSVVSPVATMSPSDPSVHHPSARYRSARSGGTVRSRHRSVITRSLTTVGLCHAWLALSQARCRNARTPFSKLVFHELVPECCGYPQHSGTSSRVPAEPTYPFVPRSTAYLRPGQFWAIPLSDGRFACGRVLALK